MKTIQWNLLFSTLFGMVVGFGMPPHQIPGMLRCSDEAPRYYPLHMNNNGDEDGSIDGMTVEQLSKDPFMKQVEYGFALTSRLHSLGDLDSASAEQVQNYLQAQLSHSDGIRHSRSMPKPLVSR